MTVSGIWGGSIKIRSQWVFKRCMERRWIRVLGGQRLEKEVSLLLWGRRKEKWMNQRSMADIVAVVGPFAVLALQSGRKEWGREREKTHQTSSRGYRVREGTRRRVLACSL